MTLNELIEWQWVNYRRAHGSRINLAIHIVAVPLFVVATVSFFLSLLHWHIAATTLSAGVMLIAFGAQGLGHSKENHSAEPFTGITQAILRIILEQFLTFPRFVSSGNWYQAWKNAG